MRTWLLAAAFLLALPLPHAAAQASSSNQAAPDASRFTLRGRVLDPMRAPVVSATVTAVSEAGGAAPSTLTDARGEFTLELTFGQYTVSVASVGFVEAEQRIARAQAGTESRDFVS